jgi:transposase
MGRVSKVYTHESEEELRARIEREKDPRTVKKLLVILNACVDPRTAKEIALHTGTTVRMVHSLIPAYNRYGLEGILGPGKGGRRNAHMTCEEERDFLEPFFERAATGEIATTRQIHEALEKHVGQSLHHSVVHRFLKRNGWRKVKPRPSHVQSKREVQDEFKKNSRKK